jgi:hypothetical protein
MSLIQAAALTTFEIAPDGTRFQMNVQGEDGKPASVSLPTQCINELMMTLPDVLRRALWNQFRDSSLRLVYQLGQTKIEKMAGKEAVILTSTTPDGFEVSFEYNRRQITELSEAFACADLSLNSHAEFARRCRPWVAPS